MVFKATHCSSVTGIKGKSAEYIGAHYAHDKRAIFRLSFDGKQIHTEWVELNQYFQSNKGIDAVCDSGTLSGAAHQPKFPIIGQLTDEKYSVVGAP